MATQNAEQTFSELCDQAGIPYERIPTAEVGEKSPDYKIVVSDHTIIVEIKQFDPNPAEKNSQRFGRKKACPLRCKTWLPCAKGNGQSRPSVKGIIQRENPRDGCPAE